MSESICSIFRNLSGSKAVATPNHEMKLSDCEKLLELFWFAKLQRRKLVHCYQWEVDCVGASINTLIAAPRKNGISYMLQCSLLSLKRGSLEMILINGMNDHDFGTRLSRTGYKNLILLTNSNNSLRTLAKVITTQISNLVPDVSSHCWILILD